MEKITFNNMILLIMTLLLLGACEKKINATYGAGNIEVKMSNNEVIFEEQEEYDSFEKIGKINYKNQTFEFNDGETVNYKLEGDTLSFDLDGANFKLKKK